MRGETRLSHKPRGSQEIDLRQSVPPLDLHLPRLDIRHASGKVPVIQRILRREYAVAVYAQVR